MLQAGAVVCEVCGIDMSSPDFLIIHMVNPTRHHPHHHDSVQRVKVYIIRILLLLQLFLTPCHHHFLPPPHSPPPHPPPPPSPGPRRNRSWCPGWCWTTAAATPTFPRGWRTASSSPATSPWSTRRPRSTPASSTRAQRIGSASSPQRGSLSRTGRCRRGFVFLNFEFLFPHHNIS